MAKLVVKKFEDRSHPTEFDQELGRQMGRDARRVAAGDLSQAAFYDRYHDAVLAEFDRDDRPVEGTDD